MGCIGNFLWIIFGGIILALLWGLVGVLWCITIVGIPVGLQCFKFASLALTPFGRDVQYSSSTFSVIINIIWLLTSGIPLAVCSGIFGLILCATIVGIPFGLQHFKLAKLALMPFGAIIINTKQYNSNYIKADVDKGE